MTGKTHFLLALDRTQAIMDINFTKFAMTCPEEALVTVPGQPLAVASPAVGKPEPQPAEPNYHAAREMEPRREREEKKCCNVL